MTSRRHPHPDRMAEVYQRDGERLIFLRYTADPPDGATWDGSLQAWVLDDATGN